MTAQRVPSFLPRVLAAGALGVLLAACANDTGHAAAVRAGGSAPAGGGGVRSAAWYPPGQTDGNWLTQGRDYGQTRYSPLDQINAGNVANLRVAWSFSTGVVHGHEGAPLVAGNTMYVVGPYPDQVYALDLTKNGQVKWSYKPNTDPWSVGIACCDVVNRGWSLADGKLIFNALDDRTIALDTATGKPAWVTKLDDVNTGTTMTMAPFVVKDLVLVGNSGGEMGVQGWVTALDVHTGKQRWRAYSTGPDSMVRLAGSFHPFYPKDQGKDLGATSWPAGAWKHGAGAVWGWISYDPELDLIYYGTSNPGPWTADQRPGRNQWTSTVFARKPETGEAVWATQLTAHDDHDYDAVNEYIITDLPINGQNRRVLVHFDRNAFGYTIDARTGEILVAQPFAYQNWAQGIDLKTGDPIRVDAKNTHTNQQVPYICPADIGGKDWQPAAYSPRTHLFYTPFNNMCYDYRAYESSYIAGTPYWGAEMKRHAGPGGNYGGFEAWDATTGKVVWKIDEKLFVPGTTLVTGADLVFYGAVDGWFHAVDARSGKELWKIHLGSGVMSPPMTYLGPDGKQYVAVFTGTGGFANLMQKEPGFAPTGGTLYVFSL